MPTCVRVFERVRGGGGGAVLWLPQDIFSCFSVRFRTSDSYGLFILFFHTLYFQYNIIKQKNLGNLGSKKKSGKCVSNLRVLLFK